MNTREGAPAVLQGRELQEAAPDLFQKQVAQTSLLVADFTSFPKAGDSVLDGVHIPDARERPPPGEQTAISRLRESRVNEQYYTAISLGPDDPADGLQDAVHTGKGISIFKSLPGPFLEVLPDQISFDTELRQAHAHDDRAYQMLSHQVNAFTEYAAQDSESCQCHTMLYRKGRQKSLPLRLGQARTLRQSRNQRISGVEQFLGLREVLE